MAAGIRAHGYADQSMVVVPPPLVSEGFRHPLLRALQVTDAGFFPKASEHGIWRANGSQAAILIACRAGRGWVRFGFRDAAVHPVRVGEAILIAPGQAHAYGSAEGESWTIQWVHFEGSEVQHWWRWHRLPAAGAVMHLRPGTSETLDLARVHAALDGGFDERARIASAAALRWALSQLATASVAEMALGARASVEAVARWMQEHRAGRVTLDDLAKQAGLSAAHFAAVFHRRFGYPPMAWFNRMKIRHACDLLAATEWPVARVGEECGFEDPFYFSRAFRKVMGLSPRAYRKRHLLTRSAGRL